MKISFFGASKTQQTRGYAKYTIEDLNCDSKIFGYGSMHLNDAGICYIDDVLNYNAEYCFIDWFSTGYIEYNKHKFDEIKEYVDTIINKFFSKNIIIIFLFFPDKSMNNITNKMVDKKEIYAKLETYLMNINVPTINISEQFTDSELKLILRDGSHTTDFGSKVYAKHISSQFLEKFYKKYQIPTIFPEKTRFDVISKLKCDIVVKKFITIEGPCEVIGISQIVGPYSGLLKINNDIMNNWDKWCHYERPMIKHKFTVNDTTTIHVLDADFNRSSCKHKQNWKVKKILNMKNIFYIGNLKILKYE